LRGLLCKELQPVPPEPYTTTDWLTWGFSCVSPDLGLGREVQTYSVKMLVTARLRSF